jgi:hypothetical protein
MNARIGLAWAAGIVLALVLSGCERTSPPATQPATASAPAGAAGTRPSYDLDTLVGKIEETWKKSTSITAKMALSSRLNVGDSVVTATGDGTYEFLRHDGKLLSRVEYRSTTLQKTPSEENRFDQHVLAISDGGTSQTLIETTGGQPRVVKSKVGPQQRGDPAALIDSLRREAAVAVLPEDIVDGRKVYVIEAILRAAPPFAPSKQRLAFDEASGFLVQILGLGEDGLPMSTVTYSDVKVDVPIPLERFTLTIPEGAEVEDATVPQTQPTTMPELVVPPPAAPPPETAPATKPVEP